ncbi:AAEL010658-PA [Aedes aegypti]|uniref:AAEL010658-PA n=2 Tax=Aedes aegypti TaxID=7159 RepID=A0A1S4FRF3_AEDAE|nr:cilia- and flagella-associated protein 20 [Aedes aegypti]EAT37316.1 AAEL010658-PA [Aedes aegypti]
MFRNTYQRGFLTVFSSSGSKPLEIWDIVTKNGHAKRVTDEELKLMSFELMGANVATTFMVAPKCPCPSLGVKLPFLVLLVKNLKKFFSFEIQILDDRNLLRRFRASNYQSATRVDNFCTVMPLALTPGWNQIQFNLADFTRRAYGTNYIETVRIQIHANVRIKRVYFCDRLYPDDELPPQLRLHPPLRPSKITGYSKTRGKKPAEAIETVRPGTPVTETDAAPGVSETITRRSTMRSNVVDIVETPAEVINLESNEVPHEADASMLPEDQEGEVPEIAPVTSAQEIAVQF